MEQLLPAPAPSRPAVLSGRIVEIRPLGGVSWWLQVELPKPGPEPGPGQFYMVRGGTWSQLLARPFSLAGVAEEGRRLGFLIDRVGRGTAELVALEEGAELLLWGPLGNAFPNHPGAIMVAGGVGLAPFLHALQVMEGVLLFGGRSASQLTPAERVPAGVDVSIATDDGSRGHHGTVVDLLATRLAQGDLDRRAPIFVCGPDPMMAAAADLAAREGLSCLVSLETAMGCGLGICSGCAVKVLPEAVAGTTSEMVLSCKSGPIFPAGAIDWQALRQR